MDTFRDRLMIVKALRAAPAPLTLVALAGGIRITNGVNDFQMPLEIARLRVKELAASGHAEKVGRHSPARWTFTWGGRPELPEGFLYRKLRGTYGVYDVVDTPQMSLSGGRLTLALNRDISTPELVGGGHLWYRAFTKAQAEEIVGRAEAQGLWAEARITICGWTGSVRAPVEEAAKLAEWIAKEEDRMMALRALL